MLLFHQRLVGSIRLCGHGGCLHLFDRSEAHGGGDHADDGDAVDQQADSNESPYLVIGYRSA